MIDSMIIDKAKQSRVCCFVIALVEEQIRSGMTRNAFSMTQVNVEIAIIAKHRSALTNKIQHFATT
jgi:hypothetical protein